MSCRVGAGVERSRRFLITLGSGGGSVSQGWSVEAGGLSLMRVGNRARTGSASMTVHGASMGPVRYTPTMRLAGTGCESTGWQSDTSVKCLISASKARGSGRVVMSVGTQGGSVSQGFSVDATKASVLRAANRAGTGSVLVTVHGTNMGAVQTTGVARAGSTKCEMTEWDSDTSVTCRVVGGAAGSRRLVLTQGGRVGSVTVGWSFDVAGLSVVRSVNRAGTGSALITVHGRGIGTHAHSAGGRIGHTGCELTLWDSDTSVRCHVGQGATGTRRAVATVGERKGSMSHGWSVDAARLSALRRANHRGTGSASVTLHGMGLGLAGGTAKSRVGNSMCEATGWESETSLRCLAGGVGGTKRAVLSVGQRTGSVSRAWSVDAAAVSVIRGGNKAGTGSAWVTVHGAGLGLESSTGKVRMGHT